MMGKSVALGICAAAAISVSGLCGVAGAATFNVNSRIDRPDDFPGDGICAATVIAANPERERPAVVRCTLRAAVMEANALPGADRINLGRGTYRLTYAGYGTETEGVRGDLDIVDKLQIFGKGKTLTTIDASGLVNPKMSPNGDRIFDIHGPGIVTMQGMTLTGGRAMGGPWDVRNQEQGTELVCPVVKPADEADGGGILNRGSIVQLKDMLFDGNLALCDGGGVDNVGDGIMVMTGCDFAYNTAIGNGGAVENDEDSIMTITSADFQWNNAMENGGALANDDSWLIMSRATMTYNSARGMGGAVWNGDSDPMSLRATTITFNSAWDGGGIFNNDGFLTMRNTIVENNAPNDIVDQQIQEGLPTDPMF
ncbi:MAG: hypothetical protein AB1568_02815 [Thermodesulfobacteriota bacterium]